VIVSENERPEANRILEIWTGRRQMQSAGLIPGCNQLQNP